MKAPLAVESLLLDGAAAGSRLVVVGERGHILTSTDDGASWTQAEVPTRVLLTALHMHDERTGWAVGHDAVILRTVDGGESWTLAHQAPEEELPLLDVWFRDERTGFAVGAYGYFLATKDGGETWTSRTISEDDFHLNALIPVPRRRPGPQDARRPERKVLERRTLDRKAPGCWTAKPKAPNRSNPGISDPDSEDCTSRPRPAWRTAPTTAARPGASCPRPMPARGSAGSPSTRIGCC